MGCLPCFDDDIKDGVRLNPTIDGTADDKKKKKTKKKYNHHHHPHLHPMAVPCIPRLSKEEDNNTMRTKSNTGTKKEAPTAKDGFIMSAHTFTFRELAVATKNFRPECFLGEGGFGPVYKGRLDTGQVVAVKQLDKNGLQGNKEFVVEVLMLSLLHHPNLVTLTGYCAEGDQRLLVYEFMPFGSLEDHLHDLPPDKEGLDWNTRMKIAEGAAKGLEYLHDTANPPVIYRDFKSSNILLDEEFNPKLSDFGLAKLGPIGDESHVSTRVMGTYGYCAPEYAMTGQLTVRSDVYSFGVVFLELITGRKAIDITRPHEEENLISWARPMFNDRNKLRTMADPKLQGKFPMRGLYQAFAVASMCIQEEASARPLIGDVVTALSFLVSQGYDPNETPTCSNSGAGNPDERDPRGGRDGRMIDDGRGCGRKREVDRLDREEPPREMAGILNQDFDREKAVADAKLWGANWREKIRASQQKSISDN